MEKMLGLGDSLLIQINLLLKDSLKEFNIDYQHLCDQFSSDINLNITNECNIGPTVNFVSKLSNLIDGKVYYDKIIIHLGLHDIKVSNNLNTNLVDYKTYETNLLKLAKVLPKLAKKIYWCLIPKIYDDYHNKINIGFKRYNHDVLKYNDITRTVLCKTDIEIVDTYKMMESIGVEYLIDHVHFNKQGIKLYQEKIMKEILLKEQKK
jgi:hypothetical protein